MHAFNFNQPLNTYVIINFCTLFNPLECPHNCPYLWIYEIFNCFTIVYWKQRASQLNRWRTNNAIFICFRKQHFAYSAESFGRPESFHEFPLLFRTRLCHMLARAAEEIFFFFLFASLHSSGGTFVKDAFPLLPPFRCSRVKNERKRASNEKAFT